MERLNELRKSIDMLDDEICKLYIKRMDVCREIGIVKGENKRGVNASEREKEIIKRLTSGAPEDLKVYIKQLYETVFSLSKNYQNKIISVSSPIADKIRESLDADKKAFPVQASVACQGVKGAYSGIAAEKMFDIPDITYLKSFESVFNAVDKGLCEYGVLPIENSNAGSVSQVYDLMKKHNFYIVKSVRVQICHVLATKPGEKLSDIKKVYSHEQALAQCAEYLRTLKVEACAMENTAVAGQYVAETDKKGIAVICSEECAEIYGLNVLEKGVQDNGNNYTRFICIAKDLKIFKGADKISVMTSLKNKSGSLQKTLSNFVAQGLNLTKLESRPIANSQFEFMFYFDFEGDIESEGVLNLIADLDNGSDKFVFLGSYKEII